MVATRKLSIQITGEVNRSASQAFSTIRGEADSTETRMSKWSKGVAGAIAGAFALDAVVDFGGEMLSLGAELEAMSGKVDTVFEGQASSIRSWADRNNESFGLTDDKLAGLAANFGDLLKPMGFTSGQAATMSQDVVGLAGALSAWTGGQTSAAEASEILASAMLGERDALKGLGINISEADVQARLAAKGQGELTGSALAQAEAVATQELIFERSKDAQAAWADGSNDALTAQNRLKASVGELKEQIAARLAPVITRIIDVGMKWASWANEHRPLIAGLAAVLGGAFLAALVSVAAAWWAVNGAAVVTALPFILIGAIIAGLAALFIIHFDTIKGAVMTAFNWVKENWPLLLGILTGPIGWAVLLIVKHWDTIKEKFTAVKDWIGDRISDVVEFFRGMPGRLSAAAGDLFGWVKDSFKGAINAVIGFWNGLAFPSKTFNIPKIHIPGTNKDIGGGSFTVGGWNLPDIPYLAEGGIVRSPTLAMIGEAGPEAVVPLGRGMGGTNIYVTLHVAGSVHSDRDLVATINRAVSRGIKLDPRAIG